MSKNVNLINGVQLTTSAVVLYTSPSNGAGTRITAFGVANTGGTTETYSMHIVADGDSADSTNIMVPERPLQDKEPDTPAEMMNQLVPPGGTIQGLASTTLKITVGNAAGLEFT